MASSGRTRADSRRNAEEEEAGPPPVLEPENHSVEATYISNDAMHIFVTTKRQFKKYAEGAISAHVFYRHMKSAWSEATCSSDTKLNMIIDNVTDRIPQL